jgi:hypothetical protein
MPGGGERVGDNHACGAGEIVAAGDHPVGDSCRCS